MAVVNGPRPSAPETRAGATHPEGTVGVERLPDGQEVAVAHLVGGRVVRFLNLCPHRGGPIGEGELDGSVITCPWHGFRFDVLTGEAVGLESIMRLCPVAAGDLGDAPTGPAADG